MKFVLERVSQPTQEPVSLQELKRHLRLFDDVTSDDEDVIALGIAGREWVEEFTARALVDQQWRLTIDQTGMLTGDLVRGYTVRPGFFISQPGFLCGDFFWLSRIGEIRLHRSPVLQIVSFKTVASDGTETTIDSTTYQLREADSKWPRIVPLDGATWMQSDLRIVFRAGFLNLGVSPNVGAVPARFCIAIKLWAEAHYDRDQVMMQKLIDAATLMIRPERVELGFA
jgi:hypothetical protein